MRYRLQQVIYSILETIWAIGAGSIAGALPI